VGLASGYMTQRISITRQKGAPDIYGNTSIQTFASIPARVNYANRLIRTASGEQKPSMADVTTDFAILVGDVITLPNGESQPTMRVNPVAGLGGAIDHYEVYL
jgi:hypothetical protein